MELTILNKSVKEILEEVRDRDILQKFIKEMLSNLTESQEK